MPSPPFWWERQIFQEIEVTLLSHKITIINPLTQKKWKIKCSRLPLYRSTCSSRHLQLRTGGFCCYKVLLTATGAFRLKRRCWSSPQQCCDVVIYTVSVPLKIKKLTGKYKANIHWNRDTIIETQQMQGPRDMTSNMQLFNRLQNSQKMVKQDRVTHGTLERWRRGCRSVVQCPR